VVLTDPVPFFTRGTSGSNPLRSSGESISRGSLVGEQNGPAVVHHADIGCAGRWRREGFVELVRTLCIHCDRELRRRRANDAPHAPIQRVCRLKANAAVPDGSVRATRVTGRFRHGTVDACDRSAIPGAAVLRLAADGGVAGDPGSCRQPQTGPASDAARRPGGDLPATEHEHAGGGPQDLPLCWVGFRSSGSIRSGARTSPISRWPRASSTWW